MKNEKKENQELGAKLQFLKDAIPNKNSKYSLSELEE
jgi:hypothetical protein